MAEIEEIQEEEETCEERSLNLLKDSKIDQEFSEAKARKRGARKHKLKRMSRPMAIPQVILELLDHDLREDALRSLSHFLIEKRKEDPENYHRAGYLFFNSCATMTILMQEITNFFGKMANESLNIRSIKRLVNVLHLFQTVAANNETRQKFVDSAIPNFLIPLILYKNTIDHYDNLRAVSLSVIGILCQGRERQIIMWAVENDMVEVCQTVIHTGSELSKVIAMHILESIMQDGFGLSYVCDGEHLLKGLMETWDNLVAVLAVFQDFSPRLLFHIIRCYVILCTHNRGLNIVRKYLPEAIMNDTFHDITEEFPVIKDLLHQLLLNVGKQKDHPTPRKQVPDHSAEEKNPLNVQKRTYCSVAAEAMLLKQIDLNQENSFKTPVAHQRRRRGKEN